MFCETRWVEKNIVLEDFQKMYEPLLQCLEGITPTDGWDGNSVIQVSGLLFGFTHRVSLTLQGSECDILKAFQIIGSVKQVLLLQFMFQ